MADISHSITEMGYYTSWVIPVIRSSSSYATKSTVYYSLSLFLFSFQHIHHHSPPPLLLTCIWNFFFIFMSLTFFLHSSFYETFQQMGFFSVNLANALRRRNSLWLVKLKQSQTSVPGNMQDFPMADSHR